MNIEQIRAAIEWIEAVMRGLVYEDDGTTIRSDATEEDREQFTAGQTEVRRLEGLLAQHAELERIAQIPGATVPGANTGAPNVNTRTSDDPYDLSEVRSFGRDPRAVAGELRSRALDAVDRHVVMDDGQKQRVTEHLEQNDDLRGTIAQLVLATGSESYHEAFVLGLAGRSDMWSDEQKRAMLNAQHVRAALSLTDANGGYAVPFTLDPTLILTNDGSTNPFRQISRIETTTTDQWAGLSSAGVTASWDGEIAEVSDDSPTFAQPSASMKQAQAFAQGSIAITQDYRALASDLQMLFADAKDNLEATAHAVGATGGNNPAGIVPLLVAFDSGSSIKTSATTDTFAVADVYATQNQTPPRNRGRAQWVANNAIINLIRQFGTANNYHGFLTDLGAGQPSQLLGNPLYESSAMDGTVTALADNYIVVHGDFKTGFLICDRVGMSVEFIPHLFNTANNLPDGRRGWFCYWRTGTALLNGNAFTLLNVT